jgi:hypothetical protein
MENQTITVTDLNTVRSIIDIACSRGAFKAEEMKEIGELYNKLSAFLDAIIAQAQAQEVEQIPTPPGESE